MSVVQSFQVLIIGGGIIGLSLARELSSRGIKKIGVVEKNSACGSESSQAAAGMLAPQSEANFADDFFKFCSESRDLYPQFAEELFDETGVDVELDQSGTLYLALTESDAEDLEERLARQKKAGLRIEKLSAKEILKIEPNVSPDVIFGLSFPNDWQVENRKLMLALRKSAESRGVKVFTDSSIERLLIENRKVVGAKSADQQFSAEKTVIATGAWTSLIKIGDVNLPLKIEPVRGQMLGFRAAKNLFSKVIYTPRGYLVPRRDHRILIGATVEKAGFDKSLTAAGEKFLQASALEIAPVLAGLKIAERWSGLRPQALDGLPVLGELSGIENLLIATAHYRNGILLAPRTAQVMADKIIDNIDSEYTKVFSSQRLQTENTITNHSASR